MSVNRKAGAYKITKTRDFDQEFTDVCIKLIGLNLVASAVLIIFMLSLSF